MIDREARNILAESLRHLASGQITNDQFDDAVWIESDDAAVNAVKGAAWYLYSDLREHRLMGSDALSESDRRNVAQFIMFLYTDLEYEWPHYPLEGLIGLLSNILSFGVIP